MAGYLSGAGMETVCFLGSGVAGRAGAGCLILGFGGGTDACLGSLATFVLSAGAAAAVGFFTGRGLPGLNFIFRDGAAAAVLGRGFTFSFVAGMVSSGSDSSPSGSSGCGSGGCCTFGALAEIAAAASIHCTCGPQR